MHGTLPNAATLTRDLGLERRLANAMEGEVRFDAFTRGRYATDASIYQIMPLGVVFPKSADDVAAAMGIAREAGIPVIARGAGTGLSGGANAVDGSLIVDLSRMNKIGRASCRERV